MSDKHQPCKINELTTAGVILVAWPRQPWHNCSPWPVSLCNLIIQAIDFKKVYFVGMILAKRDGRAALRFMSPALQ
jgi:hypothetical protein